MIITFKKYPEGNMGFDGLLVSALSAQRRPARSQVERKGVAMKVITSGTFAFALSALAAWGATNAGSAQAASWIRHPGSSCMAQSNATVWDISSGYLENSSTGASQSFRCPIEDNAEHQHGVINNLTVHVYDAHNGATVGSQACVAYWGASGGSCQPEVTSGSGFTGWTTLSPSLSSLTSNPNDFSYVRVRLPLNNGLGNSKLSGFVSYYP